MSFFDDVKWESLTPAMQGAMVDLLNGVHKKSLPFGLISRELADIVDGDFIITPKGRAVYEAGNPPDAPDSSIPQPLAELAAARERIRELERLAAPFAHGWTRYLEMDNGDSWMEYVNKYFDGELMAANYEDLAAALTRKS